MKDSLNNGLISVILPVYNVESCLRRGVECIISQTYSNLEIILIDDGSTDKSGEICDYYACKDSRVRVFHTDNNGLSAARNYGFEVSNGEYILYIDPDDWVDKIYIEVLHKSLIESDADFVQSGMKYVTHYYIRDAYKSSDRRLLLTSEEYMKKVLLGEAGVSVAGKLFKRFLIESIKNPVGRLFEDNAIICSYVHLCSRICIENEAVYYYITTRLDSITSSITRKGLKDYIWSYKKMVRDCIKFYPSLHDEAIDKYKTNIIYLWSMPVRQMPFVYLVFPMLKKSYYNYYYVYMRVAKMYILKHFRGYLKMPIKRKLQAILICFFPWPYVIYLKLRELPIWSFRQKRIRKEMLR